MASFIPSLASMFVCGMLAFRTIALDEDDVSCPAVIAVTPIVREHRRLRGFAFKKFHFVSLVYCALQCQKDSRCVSTNFLKASSYDETKGTCELNDKGMLLPIEGKELEHDEEAIYTRFYDKKEDCQLTGCSDGSSCTFSEVSKVFSCKSTLKNCAELYKSGKTSSGVYSIDPDGTDAFDVFCDQTTAGGGWTVFQKRLDGTVDFFRDWADYKRGFGKQCGEYWLGLDKINRLTNSGNYKLRVDLEDWKGETKYAEYDLFAISNEVTRYTLSLGSYSGSAGDSLAKHNGSAFSTKDQDNDSYKHSCAVSFKGAWWYRACHDSNLNGLYHQGGQQSSYADGVNWDHWTGYYYSLHRSEMKIRPVNF